MLAGAVAVRHLIHDLDLYLLGGALEHRARMTDRDIVQLGRASAAEADRKTANSVEDAGGTGLIELEVEDGVLLRRGLDLSTRSTNELLELPVERTTR